MSNNNDSSSKPYKVRFILLISLVLSLLVYASLDLVGSLANGKFFGQKKALGASSNNQNPQNLQDSQSKVNFSVKVTLFEGNVSAPKNEPTMVLNFDFTPPFEVQPNEIFAIQNDSERLFTDNLPGSKLYWINKGHTLILDTNLTKEEWELTFPKKPIQINWKESILPRILKTTAGTGPGKLPNIVIKSQRSARLEISAPPFEAMVEADRGRIISNLRLTFTFNRPMIKDQLDANLEINSDKRPIDISPDIFESYRWLSPYELQVISRDMPEKEYNETVIDKKFKVSFRPNFIALTGESARLLTGHLLGPETTDSTLSGPLKSVNTLVKLDGDSFVPDAFKLLAFEQDGFTDKGKVALMAMFNKPVKEEDFKALIKLETGGKVDQKGKNLPYSIDKIFSRGQSYRLIVEGAKNGSLARLILNSLPSADGLGRKLDLEKSLTIKNKFIILNSHLNIVNKYPFQTFFDILVGDQLEEGDLSKFIVLEPPLPFFKAFLTSDYRGAIRIVAPFKADIPTKIILKAGFPSENGILDQDTEFLVKLDPQEVNFLAFTGQGRYLSPLNPLLVRLAGRGVKQTRLQAWRIYENNLPAVLNLSYELKTTDAVKVSLRLAKPLFDFDLSIDEPNQETFDRLIDLGDLLESKPGAYVVKASPTKSLPQPSSLRSQNRNFNNRSDKYYDFADFRYHPERYLPVMVTDIGLTAKVFTDKVVILATSLKSAQSEKGVKIKIYDSANQIIFEGLSGADGQLTAPIDGKKGVFLTAQKNDDLSYLLLGQSPRELYQSGLNDLNESYDSYYSGEAKWFDAADGYLDVNANQSRRPYLLKGYEGFLVLPRALWKPGETIKVKGYVLDTNLLPPKGKFPLLWKVFDRENKTLEEGLVEISALGTLDFSSQLPPTIRSGRSSAAIYVPGETEPLAKINFDVEDFNPPRLALDLILKPEKIFGPDPEIVAKLSAAYLFGGSGQGLNFRLEAISVPVKLTMDGFEDFDFNPISTQKSLGSPIATQKIFSEEGALGDSGGAEVTVKVRRPVELVAPATDIDIILSVQADSGRWEAMSKKIRWLTRPILLGLRAPPEISLGSSLALSLVALDPKGGESVKGLKATLYTVRKVNYRDVRGGHIYNHQGEELIEPIEYDINLDNGRGEFIFEPKSAGQYVLIVKDPKSDYSVRWPLLVQGQGGQAAEVDSEKVLIALDKSSYKSNDKVIASLNAPFAGTLWLTLETDKLLWSKVQKLSSTQETIEFTAPSQVPTNAYLTAVVIRAAGEGRVMAEGKVSLEIDRALSRLNLAVKAPKSFKPSTKETIEFNLTDWEGKPASGEATVALVDEGVLKLDRYKIADPASYFYQSRRQASLFYDMHDLLLPLEKKIYPFLAPGGGDDGRMAGLFSPFKRSQLILTLFETSVPIGPDGRGQVTLDIPEYSGQARLTTLVTGKGRFALTESSIRISREVTVEPTLPLALAPNDEFIAPIRVFVDSNAPSPLEINLKLSVKGPLKVIEAGDLLPEGLKLRLGPGEDKSFRVALKAEAPEGE
ncbi:MAG: hypothetical protein LBV23_05775, partial [Deltaproteobacteria bacterium]|nr:hypothetical protein [Deltaproteobacteria bacterium]